MNRGVTGRGKWPLEVYFYLVALCWVFAAPLASLGFFAKANKDSIADYTVVQRWGLAAAIIAAVSLTVIVIAGYSARRVAPYLASLAFMFFSMSWAPATTGLRIMLWIVVSFLLGSIVLSAVGTSSAAFTGVAALLVVGAVYLHWPLLQKTESVITPVTSNTLSISPNVYILMVDGFGSPRVLTEQLDAEEGELDVLLASLAQLGLELESDAHASFAETTLSIGSMLAGQPLYVDGEGVSAARRIGLATLGGESTFVAWFKANGYRYLHYGPSSFDASSCRSATIDLCLSKASGASVEVSEAIRSLTPISTMWSRSQPVASELATVASSALAFTRAQPVLTYVHVLSPHPPYTLDERCEPLDEPVGSVSSGWEAGLQSLYVGQAVCLLQQLVEFAHSIVAADPSAIVIVQGDHGPAFGVDWTMGLQEWSDAQLAQRFEVLRLTRLPDQCKSSAMEAQLVINTLALLQSCLTGEEPLWIPWQPYLTYYGGEGIESVPLERQLTAIDR